MRPGKKCGLTATPLLLRLALGTVFIWAGSSKLLHSDPFPGERGARLAELGILPKPAAAGPVTPIVPETKPEPSTPPATEPAKEPDPPETETAPAPTPPPEDAPTTSEPEPVSEPIAMAAPRVVFLAARAQASTSDSPNADKPPRLKRLYGLVLVLDRASKPNAQGYILWPDFLSSAAWMERMAWAAALTEFIGGILILLGLLTRVAALGIFGAMVTAMWLTQIGPSIGAPGAFLGFLPDPVMSDPTMWNSQTSGWLTILWQFTLASVSLALVCCGAGRVSMDSLIFKRGGDAPPPKFERPAEQPPKRPV